MVRIFVHLDRAVELILCRRETARGTHGKRTKEGQTTLEHFVHVDRDTRSFLDCLRSTGVDRAIQEACWRWPVLHAA
jgi:hypothetical protein